MGALRGPCGDSLWLCGFIAEAPWALGHKVTPAPPFLPLSGAQCGGCTLETGKQNGRSVLGLWDLRTEELHRQPPPPGVCARASWQVMDL
jgi:hypothetical protein